MNNDHDADERTMTAPASETRGGNSDNQQRVNRCRNQGTFTGG